jgi:hypothetical protein
MLSLLRLASDLLAWILSGPGCFGDSRQASELMVSVQVDLILSQLVSTLSFLLAALG